MNSLRNKEKGFTIIEVVLVLAIAGLIFLMIFIAWPALQKNQRDTAKKNDVAVVATALGTWKSNKKGSIPSTTDSDAEFNKFISEYVPNLSQYTPSTDVVYKDVFTGTKTVTPEQGTGSDKVPINEMWIYPASKCTDDGVAKSASRQVAIVVVIESGPAIGAIYCQEG